MNIRAGGLQHGLDRGSSECWSRKGSGSGGASNNKQQAAERSGAERIALVLSLPHSHTAQLNEKG